VFSIAEPKFMYHAEDDTAWRYQPLAIDNDDELVGIAMCQIDQAHCGFAATGDIEHGEAAARLQLG
jgi:hypothetical protein